MRIVVILFCSLSFLQAADWPMWRHDPGRTASTDQNITTDLKVKWMHQLPRLKPAWNDNRLQFDKGYEPILLGARLFVGSSHDDSVAAYDANTGDLQWKFFADGPVRFAPVGGDGRIIFGSDDGHLYCLRASDGELVWKFRAVPSDRKVLGNGRLVSVWPVRGGPVLQDDRVYFAAGVWPIEGVFVFCLDAKTGEKIWINDSCSYLYGVQPHNAEAFGGLAPQGYLLVDGEGGLIVPSGNAYPARFDLATGKLLEFELPAAGRKPGGWFASTPAAKEEQKLRRRGLLFDEEVNAKRHEDKPRMEGLPEIRSTIHVADREIRFADKFPEIEEEIHSVIAGNGNLYVTTLDGSIYCLGEKEEEGIPVISDSRHEWDHTENERAGILRRLSGVEKGYACVLGIQKDDAEFFSALAGNTELKIVGIGGEEEAVHQLRHSISFPADRVSLRAADPLTFPFPKWFADLVVISGELKVDAAALSRVMDSVRPFGGKLVGPGSLKAIAETAAIPGIRIEEQEGHTVLIKSGAPEGSTNYTGDWKESADALVKAPVGLLWYGDAVAHFKRSPQPQFIDGVMISTSKDWTDASTRQGKVDYRLLDPMFTDVYTGRQFSKEEVPELRQSFGNVDKQTIQPSQYRPPHQKDDWKPEQPKNGTRINPMTGEEEPRVFPKSYGCDGGFDYGNLYTMRSGTAAFYDKQSESGTINISGPRSGCTNSVIPANGVLNVPYYYEGCTCSYPLPSALSLISMPETFEQWTSWGEKPFEELAGKIARLGINFGAPGDRKTDDDTLWLDFPNVGGPSPELRVTTVPESPKPFYRHSIFMKGGEGWPWVAASGMVGVTAVKIEGMKDGKYTVKITSSDREAMTGKVDVMKGVTVSGGVLEVKITTPNVSGIELIAE